MTFLSLPLHTAVTVSPQIYQQPFLTLVFQITVPSNPLVLNKFCNNNHSPFLMLHRLTSLSKCEETDRGGGQRETRVPREGGMGVGAGKTGKSQEGRHSLVLSPAFPGS